ncbi:hypothetical protein [Mechercharimyces sp. CAU 1602]|uniref:hypothetical protein n=1 Tax=Mechercharimyces sp. CAU 1602 TaxID=2973933 RepID=UPI00216221E9|nr:hypothetical protein [Mechercharimyces sp. CAU 1602]MCS1350086.1 hypothetical protein [Mechercharimyces sp. CAU 1602]
MNNHEFLQVLQAIQIEKFGLHNFVEHLDLAMYELPDDIEKQRKLKELRQISGADYMRLKEIVIELNERFTGNDTAEPAGSSKQWTVGTLSRLEDRS